MLNPWLLIIDDDGSSGGSGDDDADDSNNYVIFVSTRSWTNRITFLSASAIFSFNFFCMEVNYGPFSIVGYAYAAGEMAEAKPVIAPLMFSSTSDGQLAYHPPEFSNQGQGFDAPAVYGGTEPFSPLPGSFLNL